ncbi:hypothetical protein OAO72_00265 [Alphaproteobacteria bacterium]|nr:hypothetical protein [Alphaproteobacteria bacterium]
MAVTTFAQHSPFQKSITDDLTYDLIIDRTFSNQRPETMEKTEVIEVDNTNIQINQHPSKNSLTNIEFEMIVCNQGTAVWA